MFKRVYVSELNVFLSFKNGKLHDYKGNPAVIYMITPYKYEFEHWFEGRRHHDKNYALSHENSFLKIRNGKVDVFNRKYNYEIDDFEYNAIENFHEYIPHLQKTFHVLNQIPLEKLGIKHREIVDSSEKDTIKIYYNGIQHSEIGPSELRKNGTSVYYQYGVKHCEHGPAVDDKLTQSKFYYFYGILHNDNGPAFIRMKNNSIMTGWMIYGLMNNTENPSFVKEGLKDTEEEGNSFVAWYKDGCYHRVNGPAIIFKSEMYNFHEEFYYNEGKMHNLRGASIVSMDKSQLKVNRRDYYIDDVKYSKKEYQKIVKLIRKFTYKLLTPIRKRLYEIITNETNKYSSTFCKDVVNKICEYIY